MVDQLPSRLIIRKITIPPHYLESNGFSERNVQTIKGLETGPVPHLSMLCYRATPIDHQTPSPSELLNSIDLSYQWYHVH